MEFHQTLYGRRSARDFTNETISRAEIEKLLDCAVQAPSASNSQPWAFSVIQDAAVLKQLSDNSKAHMLGLMQENPEMETYRGMLSDPDFNLFYNAATLLTVYAKPEGPCPAYDCCMAAQNMMLAAHDMGLGACWIGLSRAFLDLPETKKSFGVPEEYVMVAPIILGHPTSIRGQMPRKEPQILFWR